MTTPGTKEFTIRARPRILRPEPTWRTLMMKLGTMGAVGRSVLHALCMATPPMTSREFPSAGAFRSEIAMLAGCKPEVVDRVLGQAAKAGWVAKVRFSDHDEIGLTVPDGIPLGLAPGHSGDIVSLENFNERND